MDGMLFFSERKGWVERTKELEAAEREKERSRQRGLSIDLMLARKEDDD